MLKKTVNLGSIFPTRDLTFVTDSASGFVAFAECEKTVGEVVNLGSNREVSISELIEIVSACLNKKIKIIKEKKRTRPKKSEVERLFSDSSKAKALFSWNPKIGIEEGIRKTISWMEKNIDRYKEQIYNI